MPIVSIGEELSQCELSLRGPEFELGAGFEASLEAFVGVFQNQFAAMYYAFKELDLPVIVVKRFLMEVNSELCEK